MAASDSLVLLSSDSTNWFSFSHKPLLSLQLQFTLGDWDFRRQAGRLPAHVVLQLAVVHRGRSVHENLRAHGSNGVVGALCLVSVK